MEAKESVYKKMKEDLDSRLDEIVNLHSKEIIDRAYEITVKQELVMLVQNADIDTRSLEILDKLQCPLTWIYSEWLDNDYSMLDDLKNTIDETAERYQDLLDDEMEL